MEGSHFTDGETEAQGKDLLLATQLIPDILPKAWALGPMVWFSVPLGFHTCKMGMLAPTRVEDG